MFFAACSGDSGNGDSNPPGSSSASEEQADDSDGERDKSDADDQADADPDSNSDADAHGDISAHIVFDGEELEFDEVFCNYVEAEDHTRFMGFFDGGEVTISSNGGVDDTAVIHVEMGDTPDFSNNTGPKVDFVDGKIQADIEISNSQEEKAPVVADVTC